MNSMVKSDGKRVSLSEKKRGEKKKKLSERQKKKKKGRGKEEIFQSFHLHRAYWVIQCIGSFLTDKFFFSSNYSDGRAISWHTHVTLNREGVLFPILLRFLSHEISFSLCCEKKKKKKNWIHTILGLSSLK